MMSQITQSCIYMGQHNIYVVTRSETRMKSGEKPKELRKQVHGLALHTLRARQCLCIREVSCVLLSDVELHGHDPSVSPLLLCGPAGT